MGLKRPTILLSLVGFMLAGVPIWWQTTKLQRPALPHDLMQGAEIEWSNTSNVLSVAIHVHVLPADGLLLEQQDLYDLAQEMGKKMSGNNGNQGSNIQVHFTLELPTSYCLHASWPPTPPRDGQPQLSGGPVCMQLASNDGAATLAFIAVDDDALDGALHSVIESNIPGGSQMGTYHLFVLHGVDRSHAAVSEDGRSWGDEAAGLVLGKQRHSWMWWQGEKSMSLLKQLLMQVAPKLSSSFSAKTGADAARDAVQLPISAAGQAVLSFSLCIADPQGSGYMSWYFDSFERQYVAPLVRALAPAMQLSVESQVHHYMRARVNGSWSKDHQAYVLKPKRLQFFLGSEWDLHDGRVRAVEAAADGQSNSSTCSSASRQPAPTPSTLIPPPMLHFVAYVPPAEQQPLAVLQQKGADEGSSSGGVSSTSDSFWIPSWGGVHIMDTGSKAGQGQGGKSGSEHEEATSEAVGSGGGSGSESGDGTDGAASFSQFPASTPTYMGEATMHRFAGVVLSQLRSLLGLSMRDELVAAERHASSAASQRKLGLHCRLLNPAHHGFALWEVDTLVRQRTSHDLATAGHLLGSFSRLVQSIPNLEMPHLIGLQVRESLDAFEAAKHAIRGNQQAAAHAAAEHARSHADAALSNPAVLAQLSSPESHKVGIYMPLFLPAALSLLQTLMAEIKRQRKKRKERKQAVEAARSS